MATTSESNPNAPDGTGQDDQLSAGEIFDLLSNQRRRYVIHYCKREDEPVPIGDLAEHVAAWELEKDVAEVTSAERKRVYTSLQQSHLPTLDRADVIAFDDRTIELTDEAAELDVYLDIVPGDSIPWGTYYLGLAAVGSVVMGGLWLEVIPTETVPELGWATLVVGLFAASAVVHVIQNRRLRLGEMERPP
ncbi:hypothetical protein [Natrinema pallidum]|uniref:DUF7344 domain-containing protein n=2 Tax=Natrinema pallidum TaxID=69527 RepID=L9YPH8_9EURY|nr:hypothetical protein [Natrinema pallidum]ELY75999.1 hypothetical protein C487_12888 [Natrinema pallidum DSM 3751]QCW02724.1 hypothetical protein FGF80_05520 [Natrinema pallidum]